MMEAPADDDDPKGVYIKIIQALRSSWEHGIASYDLRWSPPDNVEQDRIDVNENRPNKKQRTADLDEARGKPTRIKM
eukprot:SAG11_NODE_1258_length_5362_cov_16.457534_6_plen_77_part_00